MTTQQCLYLPIKAFSSVICKEQQPGNTYTAQHADLPVRHLQSPLLCSKRAFRRASASSKVILATGIPISLSGHSSRVCVVRLRSNCGPRGSDSTNFGNRKDMFPHQNC